MTEPDNSSSNTRPISVAELLAKNGTIGAPPVGGRRRRRRGNSDAVTVAELTGEIPIVTDRPRDAHADDETGRIPVNGSAPTATAEPAAAPEPEHTDAPDEAVDTAEAPDTADAVAEPPADSADTAEAPESAEAELADEADRADAAEADYAAHLEARASDPEPLDFTPAPRRPRAPKDDDGDRGAEEMSPDPLLDDSADELDEPATLERSDTDDDELPSYLRSTAGPLFGGQTVADDLARRGDTTADDLDTADADDLDRDLDPALDADAEREDRASAAADGRGSAFLRGAWIVGQCVIAVAFGAGLFIAFDQLWKWNNIVALVLSVLVILGLVVGVRVVRKTEDIGSTLIAVAVGALVTLGPLALLQSG
ncbi:hypothetical protein E4P42_00085 [Mycobacterium sp. PS03-16]|uniref:hypothetical protein n=1 Tax=Mycobacterium sp. PS03-16 TaxID=2559611 RepID=UPI0010741738|nr:hypothetical protein [Mycobacterium sp. PS03-16]TFV61340.1 hypothetical protein E4P42_00085 [Mycobacterium sp. PS03-16]